MLSRAEELLLSLIEHAVFSTEFDDALRSHVKARRDVESLLGAVPLSGLVADIDEALTGEAAGGGAPRDDGAGGDGDMGEGDEEVGGGAPADCEALPDDVATTVAKVATKSADQKEKMEGFVAQC